MITVVCAATGDIPATRVLGQPNFVHNDLNFIDGLGFSSPSRIVQDISVSPTRFYISDTGNNRILGWNTGSSGLINPPFVSYTSSGNAPGGAFTLK
jgi:hypothetical protein